MNLYISFCWIFFIFGLLIYKPNYFTGKEIVMNFTINFSEIRIFFSYKIIK